MKKVIFFTQKNKVLLAIVPTWPKDILEIRDLKRRPGSDITILGTDIKLNYQQKGKNVILKVPYQTADELPSKYAYSFKIKNALK